MRPLVADERIFARRISKFSGPELVCLDRESGRLLWARRPGDCVVSQPFWRRDSLLALTVTSTVPTKPSAPGRARRPVARTFDLHLTMFDPEGGHVLSQNPLVRFRDRWYGILPCRATTMGEDLVITVGGAVVCASLDGEIRWLRRQPLHPTTPQLVARGQYHGPPLVADDRIIAFQSGVKTIQCLDIETGRLVWQRELADITRVIGLAAQRLIVQADSHLTALDTEDGGVAWEHQPDGPNQAYLCGGPGGFAFVDRSAGDFGNWRLDLVWLDPLTGNVAARHPLTEIYRRGRRPGVPECGPFFRAGDRLFLGISEDKFQPKDREFYELVR
jgi:outer membrane protein assembly factor BamB